MYGVRQCCYEQRQYCIHRCLLIDMWTNRQLLELRSRVAMTIDRDQFSWARSLAFSCFLLAIPLPVALIVRIRLFNSSSLIMRNVRSASQSSLKNYRLRILTNTIELAAISRHFRTSLYERYTLWHSFSYRFFLSYSHRARILFVNS